MAPFIKNKIWPNLNLKKNLSKYLVWFWIDSMCAAPVAPCASPCACESLFCGPSSWICSHIAKNRDGPDSSFAGYPAYRISGHFKNRIPDIRPDILPDTGYFRHMINNTKILWKSCIFLSKQVLRSKESVYFSLDLISDDKNMWIWCTLASRVHMTNLILSILGWGGDSASPYPFSLITRKVIKIICLFFLALNKIELEIFCQNIKVICLVWAFLRPFM